MIWSMSSPSHKCLSYLISFCPISSTLTSPSHATTYNSLFMLQPHSVFLFFPSLNTKPFFKKLWHFKKYMIWYPPIFFPNMILNYLPSPLSWNTVTCSIPRTFHEYTFIPLSFSK